MDDRGSGIGDRGSGIRVWRESGSLKPKQETKNRPRAGFFTDAYATLRRLSRKRANTGIQARFVARGLVFMNQR